MIRSLAAPFIALTLAAGPVAAAEMTPHEAELYEAAKGEGELTWYVAQFGTEQAEEMAQVFSARYPGVRVNVIRTTGQVAYTRLMQDLRANVAQADVFSATDLSHLGSLKADGNLMQFEPENASKLREPYLNVDPDNYYFTTSANPTVIVYNTNLVQEGDAPTNWPDLLDPKWRNQVAIAHPGFSGSTGSWALLMKNLYGMEFFEKLEQQNPLIGRSLIDPPTVLTAGERSIGIASLATATRLKNAGNPIEIVFPTDGAKLTLSASAVLANAPHPNAGKLLIDWLLSEEGAHLQVKQGQQPLRPEVSPPPGVPALDEVPLAPLTEEEVAAGVPGLIEDWRDIFGN
jgi:iron(III) transport system substrate-binding protein